MPDRNVIVLTAPSGTGKTTIARRVQETLPEVEFSVSATTRPRRPNETHGEDYYFLSPEAFQDRIDAGDMLEFEEVYDDKFYGTLRSEIATKAAEHPILLDIEVNGAFNVKKEFGDDALVIFIAPPSMDELRRRLTSRGTEEEHDIAERLERAEMEIERQDEADVVVVNDDLDRAVDETLAHIRRFLHG